MEVIMKNETTSFDNIEIGQIFESDHGFFLKISYDTGFDVYNDEMFPFNETEKVTLHRAKLIIE